MAELNLAAVCTPLLCVTRADCPPQNAKQGVQGDNPAYPTIENCGAAR
jgi:hypothetical protein